MLVISCIHLYLGKVMIFPSSSSVILPMRVLSLSLFLQFASLQEISLVTYIYQGGIFLLGHFTLSAILFIVSNLHPSRQNLITRPFWAFCLYPSRDIFYCQWLTSVKAESCFLAVFLFDLHLFKGFCHVYSFVSNLHPSGQNIVT